LPGAVLLVAGLGLAMLGGGAATAPPDAGRPGRAPLVCQAELRDFVQEVRATGKLRAEKVTRITCALSDHFITDIVPEGGKVKKGEPVVELDRSGIEEQIMDAKDEIVAAEAALAAAQAACERTKLDIGVGIEELEAKLEVAQARLKLEESKPLPERQRVAEARVKEAEAKCSYAQYWLQIAQELFDDGVLSQQDTRLAELDRDTATIALQQSKSALAETMKGAKAEDLDAAKAALTEAQVSLQEARETKEQRIKRADADVQVAENSLEQCRKRLAQLEEDLAKTRILAEHDGAVFSHEDRRFNVGDPSWQGLVLADLADTKALVLDAIVRECDSQLVKVGQAATVYLLPMGGRPVRGTVAKVASALTDDPVVRGVRYLEAEIRLEEIPPGVLPGMSGHADIEIRRIPGALLVPQGAVADNEVTVITKSGPVARHVEVLAVNGTEAAIGSGLAQGEWVQLCNEE
jgi:multidrug efflux pump subunit AcrA (membrane-fusion protein)